MWKKVSKYKFLYGMCVFTHAHYEKLKRQIQRRFCACKLDQAFSQLRKNVSRINHQNAMKTYFLKHEI